MNITNAKKEDETLTFTLGGTTPAFANALRRLMMMQVPTLAIKNVSFFVNSSALYDEMIAQRLGLIPLTTDAAAKTSYEVTLSIDKEGPCTVYSGDLVLSDSKTKVVDEKIPIVKLIEGQQLKLEATAIPGVGKEHAKYQPAIVSYGYEPGEDKFRFIIESTGTMASEKIAQKAAGVLSDLSKEFSKCLSSISSSGSTKAKKETKTKTKAKK